MIDTVERSSSSAGIVAITGATGFVGRCLVRRHLQEGYVVRILTRQRSINSDLSRSTQVFHGDIASDTDVLREFAKGADILYHCAAELNDPGQMERVTVIGTRNLLAAASGNIRHWVQLSSVAVYGGQPERIVDEDTPPNLEDTYPTTLSKLSAEKSVINASHAGQFTYSILRPCKIYGREMKDNSLRVLANLVGRGLFFFVGEPGAQANYVHVGNVTEALYLCGTNKGAHGRVFNLGDGSSLEALVEEIARAKGVAGPKLRLPRRPVELLAELGTRLIPGFPLSPKRLAGLMSRTHYESDAIRSRLGYQPCVSLRSGIQELIS
jgi:nucleoside-diphosphate-sugar epimerase